MFLFGYVVTCSRSLCDCPTRVIQGARLGVALFGQVAVCPLSMVANSLCSHAYDTVCVTLTDTQAASCHDRVSLLRSFCSCPWGALLQQKVWESYNALRMRPHAMTD